MYVEQPRSFLLWAHKDFCENWHPIWLVRDWIHRDCPEVMRVYKILKRLRSLLLVQSIVIDCITHRAQICFQDFLTTPQRHWRFSPPYSQEYQGDETKRDKRNTRFRPEPQLHISLLRQG